MAADGPLSRKKMLLALDLDYVHFDKSKPDDIKAECLWIGGKDFWLNLYSEIITLVESKHIDIVFCVVTNKPTFDDFCAEAADAFRTLLERHNHHMYQEEDWILVDNNCVLRYEAIYDIDYKDGVDENAVSHFVVRPWGNKAPLILNIAAHHGVDAKYCMLLDDTPKVLKQANKCGIRTISFTEFNPGKIKNLSYLDDPIYIHNVLSIKRLQIINTVQLIIDELTPKAKQSEAQASEVSFSDELENDEEFFYIPPGYQPCMSNWQSRNSEITDFNLETAFSEWCIGTKFSPR